MNGRAAVHGASAGPTGNGSSLAYTNSQKLQSTPTLTRLASMLRRPPLTEEEQEETLALTKPRKPPIETKWNFFPCLLLLAFFVSGAYYFYIRFRGVINLDWPLYQSYFLALELLGVSAFLPYAVLLTRGVFPTGSEGLPAADSTDHAHFGSTEEEPTMPKLRVHVMVPCYKEPLEVIHATVTAALSAPLPANTTRTVYLCDDGKDPNKKMFIEDLQRRGLSAVYVSGRTRKRGEVNGKSANLNNCLKNVIFANTPRDKSTGEIDWTEISNKELLVVFDADMCANKDFFLKLLEVMVDDNISLCLTPQSFHNVDTGIDLFNSINTQFWEYWLPGAFAWGYIACTGTNFCLRARALAHCGWFPEYTITEDYALGMELKARGYKATYLMQIIAVGEAPDEVRNVFRQRSRWTKGHFQVFFSRRCPLLNWELPFFQRLWYSYAAWSPLCTVITVPCFMLAPLLSVFFGIHPVSITFDFVLSSTVYLVIQYMIQYYVRTWAHIKLMWYVNLSNIVLWFTYTKAFVNSMMGLLGMKAVVFKATDKGKADGVVPLLGVGGDKPDNSNPGGPPKAPSLVRAASRTMSRAANAIKGIMGRGSTLQREQISDGTNGVQLQGKPTLESGMPQAGDSQLSGRHTLKRIPEVTAVHATSVLRNQSLRRRPGGPSEHMVALNITPSSEQGSQPPSRGSIEGLDGGSTPTKYTPTKESYAMQARPPADKTVTTPAMRTGSVAGSRQASTHEIATQMTHNPMVHNPISGMPGQPIINYNIMAPGPYMANPIFGADAASPFVKYPPKGVAADGEGMTVPPKPTSGEKQARPGTERLKKVLASFRPQNITDFDYFDPLALFLMWALNIVIFSVGIWQMTLVAKRNTVTQFELNSPLKGNPYLLISTLWAIHNSVAPYLFLHYCCSSGKSFRWMTDYMPTFTTILLCIGIVLLWLMIPSDVGIGDALDLSAKFFYPAQVLKDTNTNYNFMVNINGTASAVTLAVLLSRAGGSDLSSLVQNGNAAANVNLLGGLVAGPDYVKAIKPTAYSVAHLSWSLTQFPTGFTPAQRDAMKAVIKSGADYIMRCNLNVDNPDNPVFVAQLGDPSDYMVIPDPGYAPELSDPPKYWSSPSQDPQLAGDVPRKAWLLTRETVGADLLADAAGALAAATLVLKDEPAWVQEALKHATYIYDFALRDIKDKEKLPSSYCKFVPCTVKLDIRKEVTIQAQKPDDDEPKCYYADWNQKACLIGFNTTICDEKRAKTEDVFLDKATCCGVLAPAWNGTTLKRQGICLLENAPGFCYIPDQSKGTCFPEPMDKYGNGCTGNDASDYFPTPPQCCDFLFGKGLTKLGGVCAPKTGWITDVQDSTCVACNSTDTKNGTSCATSGETYAETLPLCCEKLYSQLGILGQPLPATGLCKKSKNPVDNSTVNGVRRFLQAATPAPVSAANIWPLPDQNQAFKDPCKATSRDSIPCKEVKIETTVEVPYFNSTSVFDDLAWGAAWMYLATGNRGYQGQAQRYVERYYKDELEPDALNTTRELYRSNWDNTAWLTDLLLANMSMNSHNNHRRVRDYLNAWLFGDAVPVAPKKDPPPITSSVRTFNTTKLPNDNTTYNIIPSCLPTSNYENECGDGIDNDCDGYIDTEDTDCGLFPVLYTKKSGLAWSGPPSLPHTANAAFMALVYSGSETVDARQQSKLRCWALAQVGHMVGSGVDERSYVVGMGNNPPSRVQHRASSCPENQLCDWNSGYYPATPNPQLDLIKGALVAGPNLKDEFSDDRTSPDTMVTLHDNVAFTGALAGLAATDTHVRSCEAKHGIWQKYISSNDKL